MSEAKYNFVQFTNPNKIVSPLKMRVGQVVVRRPCSKGYRYQLKRWMTRLSVVGKQFSTDESDDFFAIRRDQ
jgi:hypothetical protein